jgi:uncharacterized protein (TIGR03790 family)
MVICLIAGWLRAAGPGDEVILIYNSRMPESKALAEYYAARRQVPTNQIFGFALSTGDEMSRAEYRDELEKPLARQLEKQHLWHIRSRIIPSSGTNSARVEWRPRDTKLRYAVLCYGVPYRISADPGLKESEAESQRPELRRNEAAVDNELALLPCIEQHLPLSGPAVNPAYASTNAEAFNPTNGLLMVARLDGPSAAIARGLVDKALAAETNGLWGRAYFDLRNISDPGYKAGDEWIRGAAEICRHLGFETVVDENPGTFPPDFPMSQIAFYSGWYDDNVSGPFTRPNVEFMPGAFAYHLHSYSAHNLRSATFNWVGPLLAKGATLTMGSVAEPYLGGTPNIAVFTGRFIFLGFTFGEAAYAAQPALSWQTTVVGDPLYRPFSAAVQRRFDEAAQQQGRLPDWYWLRVANLNLARGAPSIEIARFLNQLDVTKQSAVLTEKLGDLYTAEGKPSSSAEMYERALTLQPSPQQRVRLRLALANRLIALNREPEAAEDLGALLRENPDYPAKLEIYRRLLSLAQKLGKLEAASNYEARIRELTPPPPPPPKSNP